MSGMNKESIKSVLLTILVLISLFFTWNLWNSKPPFEEFQNNSFFESIPISNEEREPYEVIRPQQLFVHTSNQHFSTFDDQYLKSLWNEMQKWDFSASNDRNLTHTYTKEKFTSWVHEKDEAKIELRFLDGIPMETFESMFEWDTDTNEDISFDRIYLNVPQEKEVQMVYFVSSETLKIVETSVNMSDANQFVGELFSQRNEFQPFFKYGEEDGTEFLLPVNKVKIDSFQYVTDEIDGAIFKDALFSNPRIVKQDVDFSKNRYTDSSRELNIFPNEHMVRFVNPTLRNTSFLESNMLVDQSIDYLNDHGGWTDNYFLFNINELNQEIKYVMSIQSIPVFESSIEPFGPTMISQRWGQNEIAIYERPSYQLMTKISSSNTETLMSGHELVDILTKDSSIEINNIKGIYIMYELGGETDQRFVKITPSWCLELIDGTLIKIDGNQRGDKSGLE